MLLVFLKIVNFPKYFWEIGLNFGIPIDFNWEIPMGNKKRHFPYHIYSQTIPLRFRYGISHTVVRHNLSLYLLSAVGKLLA